MDSVRELLRALPASKRPFWVNAVGAEIVAANLTERQMIRLARQCILHAHGVNQRYFATRVTAEPLALLEQIIAWIEEVSSIAEFPSGDTEEMSFRLKAAPDSADEIVPGWVALLDAIGPFVSYRNERSRPSLFWAIASAYQSVSNRACAEFHRAEGNCGFMEEEKEIEQANELCAREIEYQRHQLKMEG